MKEVGIFYGSSSGKTAGVALKILEKLGHERVDLFDIADASPSILKNYSLLILGISTWGIGDPQDDWIDFINQLEDLDLRGKKVALFGLGDQESYPDSFADALGKLHDVVSGAGCNIVGAWPTESYSFMESAALRKGMFTGLVLDEDNQAEMTDQRLDHWLKDITAVAVDKAEE